MNDIKEWYIIEHNRQFEGIGLTGYMIHSNTNIKFGLYKTLQEAQKAIAEYIINKTKGVKYE